MAKLPNIIEHKRSNWKTISFVLRETYKGSKKYTLIRYISVALISLFVIAQFGAFGIIVNEFVVNGIDGARTAVLIKGFIMLVISQFGPDIIRFIANYAFNVQTNDTSRHMQSLLFKKVEQLDIGTIEQPEFQNVYEISRNRGWNGWHAILMQFATLIRSFAVIIVTIISIIAISPLAFAIIFIGALPTYFIERKNAILSAKTYQENAEYWRIWSAKTSVIGHKDELSELKNFSLVNIFRKKFLEVIGEFHKKLQGIYKNKLVNDLLSEAILAVSYGIVFALLIRNVYTGELAVGALVFSFGVVTHFQSSINELFASFGRIIEHKRGVDIFLDLLEMEPLITSGEKKILPDEFKLLEINNISFSYPGSDRKVLNNISLKINHGDNIAIVGLNGAGKSTLLKLLTRVYDPVEGEILINGINLKEYDLESWKRCLGILLQEYTLYSEETIAENIMLGDTLKHEQDIVEQSAIETTAHEFIKELPEGYDQRIGTEFRGGVELSKGQKQKTVLARVLYRRAPILILDEPTASVDALSEDTIFKSLKMKHENQTRIIISHKFSNVRDADKIILIQDGTILEEGTHDELIQKKKGKYRELFELQAEGYK